MAQWQRNASIEERAKVIHDIDVKIRNTKSDKDALELKNIKRIISEGGDPFTSQHTIYNAIKDFTGRAQASWWQVLNFLGGKGDVGVRNR